MGDVRHLAVDIGPRLATGPRFREAARWVARRLRDLDYDVTTQTFPVPAGDSWGVPVGAGTSANVVARPKGFDPGAPYLLVGAHLDTVAVAPGAEDNASGVSVLLETARRTTILPRRLPVVFVAFGGEEPRGPGDLHHFGSLHYVAQMSPAERRNLRAMVSMDRVGVGSVVPIASVPGTPIAVRAALRRSADAARHRHLRRAEHGQRPRVVRGRRAAGRAARQHAVRRLPLGRRRPVRRRPRAAAPGRSRGLGLHLPSPLKRQKFANIRSAAAYGTTRGAWSAPIR